MLLTLMMMASAAGVALAALLIWTCLDKSAQIWPSPGTWSWQSLLFWSLFRILNIAALALSFLDWQPWDGLAPERWLGAGVALVSFGMYGLACYTLGHANLYCGKEGLVIGSVYRWTRNPQYATAIPAYLGLALVSQAPLALLPILLVVTCFVLMALAEEPWLAASYGEAYSRYCQQVPRFYNWRHGLKAARLAISRAQKALKEMRSEA